MIKYEHTGHIAYKIKDSVIVVKNKDKIKFYSHGKFFNFKFYIKKYFTLIRLPFFYFHKNNTGIEIGLPNFYVLFINK